MDSRPTYFFVFDIKMQNLDAQHLNDNYLVYSDFSGKIEKYCCCCSLFYIPSLHLH